MKFNIVYADPPLQYKDSKNPWVGTDHQYPTLSLKDIKSLPVVDICEKDCMLFLWVTFHLLKEGIEVLESWGFKYKTLGFNWIKTTQDGSKFVCGCGSYTRTASEICLIGVRGKYFVKNHAVHSVIKTPRGKHSQKPQEVRDRIVQLVGDLPRIELFSRQEVEGWITLGNGINGKDIREELERIKNL